MVWEILTRVKLIPHTLYWYSSLLISLLEVGIYLSLFWKISFYREMQKKFLSSWNFLNMFFRLRISLGMDDQFKKYSTEIDSKGSPYDYGSVMHYGETAFSKDRSSMSLIL